MPSSRSSSASRLGPGDGRFLIRAAPGGAPDHVLVLGSLVSTERARRRDRRGRSVEVADPATLGEGTARPSRGAPPAWRAALAARRLASAG
ncbi:MAG: hypothetical protein ACR2LH_00550 [Thermoleophilaceae bacterium]